MESRTLLPVSLSYDHRVIDGGSAARFIVDLAAAIQNASDGDLKL
jgi:pyruvate/2-oxoglutarate dehydrogenase complex dihydrolipoamide acyltransferase (E2) component